jgi:GTP-binding protein
MKRLPKVAIIGKPNSGKSTLFNRIIHRRRAIAHARPGVTRDTVEETMSWNGVDFTLVDTGGYHIDREDPFAAEVRERIRQAARQAAVIVFLADVDTGPTSEDDALLKELRDQRSKMIVAVNKVESDEDRWSLHEFLSFGFPGVIAVSAAHGSGVGELLDEIAARLPRRPSGTEEEEEPLTIAIIGKPNVGKSSLVNALVGAERNIVTEIPGTTRDSVSLRVRWRGREFILIDTAGVKRRARTERGLDRISSFKSLESARHADVVLVMLDASTELSRQDARVAAEGHRARTGVAILVNKWDLVEKSATAADEYVKKVREAMPFLYYAPVLTISALRGLRVDRIFPLAVKIEAARELRVPTAKLNELLEGIIAKNPPSYYAGGSGKIYYATQTGIRPPTFTLFVNKAAYFPRSYIRYLNNQIRKVFTSEGTAIKISLRSKER